MLNCRGSQFYSRFLRERHSFFPIQLTYSHRCVCVVLSTFYSGAKIRRAHWTQVTANYYFFKTYFIYLFGCAGSKLWPSGSSIFTGACEIFSCTMWTLSFGMWDLVPWPWIKCRSPALGALSLSHWTTKKVPRLVLKKDLLHYFLC